MTRIPGIDAKRIILLSNNAIKRLKKMKLGLLIEKTLKCLKTNTELSINIIRKTITPIQI